MGNFDLCGMLDHANAAVNTFHFHLHALSSALGQPTPAFLRGHSCVDILLKNTVCFFACFFLVRAILFDKLMSNYV